MQRRRNIINETSGASFAARNWTKAEVTTAREKNTRVRMELSSNSVEKFSALWTFKRCFLCKWMQSGGSSNFECTVHAMHTNIYVFSFSCCCCLFSVAFWVDFNVCAFCFSLCTSSFVQPENNAFCHWKIWKMDGNASFCEKNNKKNKSGRVKERKRCGNVMMKNKNRNFQNAKSEQLQQQRQRHIRSGKIIIKWLRLHFHSIFTDKYVCCVCLLFVRLCLVSVCARVCKYVNCVLGIDIYIVNARTSKCVCVFFAVPFEFRFNQQTIEAFCLVPATRARISIQSKFKTFLTSFCIYLLLLS